MTKREKLIDLLQEMYNADLVALHNEYCYATNSYDDEIFDCDMFDEVFDNYKPTDIANRIYYGDYNAAADYFTFNGYGNIQSIFGYALSEYISINEIVDYIIENDCHFDNDDILYILDDIEEDSEE